MCVCVCTPSCGRFQLKQFTLLYFTEKLKQNVVPLRFNLYLPSYLEFFRTFPLVLSLQRSSAQEVRCTRNVVVPVAAPVHRAGIAMMVVVRWVFRRVSQVASAHPD